MGETQLLLIDLGKGAHLLGGSCLAQVYNEPGDQLPDVNDPFLIHNFFKRFKRSAVKNYY
ncbi:hypothetical protein [Coxiella-like endosymbiont]|uniref:hypothetical protein n=1 Tax=Coxiella-like endosymbiont TaxID=1592897 RepID=UPI00272CBBB6|nr:hypothetical protein [Coxiella-like endosymbiont]